MKLFITQTEYDALSEELQKLYTKSGDKYKLGLDDEVFTAEQVEERVTGLESKMRQLLDEKKRLEREQEERERKRTEEEGNFKSLYEEAQQKLEDLQNEKRQLTEKQLLAKAREELEALLGKHSEGKQLKQLMRLNSDRLKVVEGEVRVMKDGKPTISSISELANSIVKDEEFDNLIIGSRANGGNEHGGKGGGTTKTWEDLSPADKKQLHEENPEEYNRLRDSRKKR